MMLQPEAAWHVRRLLGGCAPPDKWPSLPEAWKKIIAHLETEKPYQRVHALGRMLAAFPNGESLLKSIVRMDPLNPPAPRSNFATAADLLAAGNAVRWIWEGWIPANCVIGVAAYEGTGKTRFLMDLARILYQGLPWPDGQPATLPKGTKTLWVCADGHQDELAAMLPSFGLPGEALIFPAPPHDPYDGTDIDDPELVREGGILEQAIQEMKPGLVVIDTLTNATARDLCSQAQMKFLKAPLVRLVQTHATNVVLSLHLNKDGQALGRRIRGITRTLIHLECPDPTQSGRLRLWVEKSYDKKPPALGVTMSDHANTYDANPPAKGDATRHVGRPVDSRKKAVQFIREALEKNNDQLAVDLCREWTRNDGSDSTFWRAVNQLCDSGDMVTDGGAGTGQRKILHLVKDDSTSNSQNPGISTSGSDSSPPD